MSKKAYALGVAALLMQACGIQEPDPKMDGAPTSTQQGDNTSSADATKKTKPKAAPKTEDDTQDQGQIPAPQDPVDAAKNDEAQTADEPTPPPVDPTRYSKGSGGATGMVEQTFKASNGLTSTYKINAPADAGPDKPYGLHIHFHGDGGGGYRDFPNKETRNDLIGVTVKSPNAALTWGRADGVAHTLYAQELIQNELIKKYNVDLKRIYFSGVSGGAYFLAGSFIPAYGKVYRTGAFLMCGGEAPRVAFDDPSFLKDFVVYWQVTAGERADINQSVRRSIAAYKTALDAAGGDAALQGSEFTGAGGHCEFDGKSYTTGIQYMLDLKFKTVLRDQPAS